MKRNVVSSGTRRTGAEVGAPRARAFAPEKLPLLVTTNPQAALVLISHYENFGEMDGSALTLKHPNASLGVPSIFRSIQMRELTVQEMDQASGGILPLIGFGLALAGKLAGSSGVVTWGISSASLILGTYGAAAWLDDRMTNSH